LSSLTRHLQGDDELSYSKTPTPKELKSDGLEELYIEAFQGIDKFYPPGTCLVPWDFNYLRSVNLHLFKDLILTFPRGDAMFSSLGDLIFSNFAIQVMSSLGPRSFRDKLMTTLSFDHKYLISI
jgi:hypothetical protein